MKVDTLEALFEGEVKDLYSAENQIVKALPKMAKAATSDELRQAFEDHLGQTRSQAQRLEQIAQQLDMRAKGKKCVGMEGLLEEGKEIMSEAVEPVLDAALIGAAQKVEHYEIASYGTAIAHAEQLGYEEAASLLRVSLAEEEHADQLLTEIAESQANLQADDEADEPMGEKAAVMENDEN
ncbi:MAG: YciE/YciF ferroxidase family protein, partial [Anaerolineales bacterium]